MVRSGMITAAIQDAIHFYSSFVGELSFPITINIVRVDKESYPLTHIRLFAFLCGDDYWRYHLEKS